MNVEGAEAEREIGKTVMPLMHAFFSFGTVAGAATRRRGIRCRPVGLGALRRHRRAHRDRDRRRGAVRAAPRRGRRRPAHRCTASAVDRTPAREPRRLGRRAPAAHRRHHARHVVRRGLGQRLARPRRRRRPRLRRDDRRADVRRVHRGDHDRPRGRRSAARPLRPGAGAARHARSSAIAGLALFIFGAETVDADRRHRALGPRLLARLPRRHVGRRRRPGQRRPARVSAVAIIGYCAFLVGPPLLGFLGQQFGILNALLVILVLLVLSALRSGRSRAPAALGRPRDRAARTAPRAAATDRAVIRSPYTRTVRLVIARCSVDYAGRLSAHLPLATRLLMVKGDGSLLVHSDGGSYKPLNWMSPPCTLTTARARRRPGRGRRHRDLERRPRRRRPTSSSCRSTRCCTTPRTSSASTPASVKDGVEAHLQKLLAEQIELLGDGHRSCAAST